LGGEEAAKSRDPPEVYLLAERADGAEYKGGWGLTGLIKQHLKGIPGFVTPMLQFYYKTKKRLASLAFVC